jgi:antitoxin ParD1/3/4
MGRIEKVSVALSSEMVGIVKDAVATGQYASASEVVREALREWHLRKPLRQAEIERLRKAWQEGIESGPSRPLDMDEIRRKAELRLKELQTSRNG